MKSKQSGVTLIGFLVIMAIVAFLAYMGMKLLPSYSEYMGVVKAMNQLKRSGIDGTTLLIVGAIGALLSMIFWSSWAGPGYWSRRRGAYADEAPPPGY